MSSSTAPTEAREAPSEARLQRLLGLWWLDERPAWTDPSWWQATLAEPVRRLLWLHPGPDLVAELAATGSGPMCPVDHTEDRPLPGFPVPGRAEGWPCACQVVTAAAWDACASWVATRSAQALVTAAGREQITFRTPHAGHHLPDPAREELAHALRSSIPSMGNRIAAARALARQPRLVELVTSGAISAWAGRLVTDHLTDLDDAVADRVVAEVARRVHERIASGRRPYHSAEVNRLARAARLRVCPEQAEEARVRAFADRSVSVHPQGDGMATLIAHVADIDAHRIHRRLTAIASGLQSDSSAEGAPEARTRDQIRADVLVDLLLDGSARRVRTAGDATHPRGDVRSGNPDAATRPTPTRAVVDRPSPDVAAEDPRRPAGPAENCPHASSTVPPDTGPPRAPAGPTPVGRSTVPEPSRDASDDNSPAYPAPSSAAPASARPGTEVEVHVIVTLETLLRLTDDPARVQGLGPVPADVARTLAADSRWRAWITDASGAVTATGSLTYTPGAALARLVRAREQRCRFPGCHQPAARCDLDHAIPWPTGSTSPENLGPLCRRHHNFKTHGLWELDPEPSRGLPDDDEASTGGWRWRSPSGLAVLDSPEPALE